MLMTLCLDKPMNSFAKSFQALWRLNSKWAWW